MYSMWTPIWTPVLGVITQRCRLRFLICSMHLFIITLHDLQKWLELITRHREKDNLINFIFFFSCLLNQNELTLTYQGNIGLRGKEKELWPQCKGYLWSVNENRDTKGMNILSLQKTRYSSLDLVLHYFGATERAAPSTCRARQVESWIFEVHCTVVP